MDFQLLYQLVTGKPDVTIAGSFATQNIVFPDEVINNIDVILLGLPDDDEGKSFEAAIEIRNQLYKLSGLTKKLSILDLGNIIMGQSFAETNERLRFIVEMFLDTETKIIFIGNTTVYHKIITTSFVEKNFPLNQVWIDSSIQWDHLPSDPLSINPLREIANAPVNFINIGYQSYLVEKEVIDFIHDTNFEAYRLGLVRSKIQDFEPIMRDANLVNFSLNAVKYSDCPGAELTSPNGLSGDEICQLAFYAGYSNRIKSVALYNYVPALDIRKVSALLAAQVLWHVLEGMAVKIVEDPQIYPEGFLKYHIHLDIADQNLAFYKSNLTNRWWMEVVLDKPKRSVILSCSEKDYDLACLQELPDRWWRLFNRI